MFKKVVVFVLLICVCIAALPAQANDKAGARRHFETGKQLMEVEDFAGAAAEFEVSASMYPTKNSLFNLAQCQKALHRYGDVLETVEQLKQSFGDRMNVQMLEAAADLVSYVQGVVATLMLRVSPSGAHVTVDGDALDQLTDPLLLGPGAHKIVVTLASYQTQRRTVQLVSKMTKTERFELKPNPAAPLATVTPPASEPAPAAEEESTNESDFPLDTPLDNSDKSRLSGLFWTGLAFTVVTGVGSGVMWGLSSSRKSLHQKETDNYETLSETPAVTPEQESAAYKKVTDAQNDATLFNKIAIGSTIATGILATATLIIMGVNLSNKEAPPTDDPQVSLTPSGIQVSF